MGTNISTPGRNFLAPSGKKCALFLDLDGTILECEKYFRSAWKRFELLMSLLGFDAKVVCQDAQALKVQYHAKHGYPPESLGKAFIKAYCRACRTANMTPRWDIIENCRDIGHSPHFREPELFPEAAPVLNRARYNFLMVAVTCGDRDVQYYKIKKAGLRSVFDHVIVTQHSIKSELVAAAIADMNIDPKYSLFIGDSLGSDGQCLKNTNFLHLPLEGSAVGKGELPKFTAFSSYKASSWREAEEMGINRLIRQRQVALELEAAKLDKLVKAQSDPLRDSQPLPGSYK